MEEGNAIKEFVDEKVDALIKALRETESIELQYLSKANKDFKDNPNLLIFQFALSYLNYLYPLKHVLCVP
jgi:hypothetical protein